MKNTKKIFGIIAILTIIGFSAISCDDDVVGDNATSSFIGETLNFKEQVWLHYWDDDELILEQFKGNITGIYGSFFYRGEYDYDEYDYILLDIGGSGSIINGQLNFLIETPSELVNIQELFGTGDGFNNFNISPSNAKAVMLQFNTPLGKSYFDYSTEEYVEYYYVDRDVTITGGGKTHTYKCDCVEYYGYCDCEDKCYCGGKFITKNLNLRLKAGWNVITTKSEYSEISTTVSMSAGDSSRAKWLLYGEDLPPSIWPPENYIQLTAGTWANGNFTSSVREQYFRFTATSNQHYIHFNPGAVDDVYVDVFDSSGYVVGDIENFYGSHLSYSWILTSGQTYYIRVQPYYDVNGNYQIAFNSSSVSPLSASLSINTPSFSVVDSKIVWEKTKKTEENISCLQTHHQKKLDRR